MTVSDEFLIKAFQKGDDLAFVNLYNRYKKPVYVFCLKMLGKTDDAKDIVQGVFLKIYERRDQIMYPERFKSWLLTIARNDCLTSIRKASYTSELPDEMEDTNLILPPHDIDRDEEVRLVNQAIRRLKADYREVVIMREYQNLSYQEIAEVIGTTESVVKSRLFTARQRLYELLKPIYDERKES